ncbi:2-oxoglutarate dehydrogenase [Oceanidesulfovibrio indonesiensis]|uniref:2-oxoglutarate dehydrogenase n=2 Tax=Oceanidesulfovibrio indonesiensis TaxID=54767 RepID=A0A7M3MKT7_9BACT|nr:2-oxoglutarate dehydrogenase [Oceanidesulfovibrio indonesiensis]
MDCSLVVLGAGPGGYDAALEAAALGMDTVLVEREHLGGTCLNWGCIPTKLFLGASAPVSSLASHAKLKLIEYEPEAVRVSLPAMQNRKRKMLAGTHKAMALRLRKAGVTLLTGTGRFTAPGTVEVTDAEGNNTTTVHYNDAVVATGAGSASFPSIAPDGEAVLDPQQLLELESPPNSLVIVGGGAIGIEMGEVFARLGASITLIEAMDRLLPYEDPEIGEGLAKLLKRDKWTLRIGERVESLKTVDGRAVLTMESGETMEADKALVAVGRKPNSAGMGLEDVGCELDPRGFVKTDENLSAAEHVYAVGDVNGLSLLAHAATHQAHYVVRRLAGREQQPYRGGAIPACVYGSHEMMRAGLTEALALDAGGEKVEVSRFQLAANPYAQAQSAGYGFVKAIWLDDILVGVSALGHGVSHLVTLAEVLVREKISAERLGGYVFAHPTLDEALAEALRAPREHIR